MLNTEQKIKSWKKSLRTNRSFEDGYIEELESHLRDLIEEEINNGKSEEEALDFAIRKIGKTNDIGNEFYKSDTTNKISGRPSWKAPRWMPELIWNYFKVGLRNIKRQKVFSAINILGLSIGLASVIIISLVVLYETSFDQSFKNKDDIYRVCLQLNRSGEKYNSAISMFPLAPVIEAEVPGIKSIVRISESFKLLSFGDKKFYEDVSYVDKDFFKIFSQQLIFGDIDEVLKNPYSMVIDEDIAEKFFGKANPVGKTIRMQNADAYTVTGVYKKFLPNSHIQKKILASVSTLYKTGFERLESWGGLSNDYTYILIDKNSRPAAIEKNINASMHKKLDETLKEKYKVFLQPLNKIHFSNLMYDFAETTPPVYLYILSSVALFILIIAYISIESYHILAQTT